MTFIAGLDSFDQFKTMTAGNLFLQDISILENLQLSQTAYHISNFRLISQSSARIKILYKAESHSNLQKKEQKYHLN